MYGKIHKWRSHPAALPDVEKNEAEPQGFCPTKFQCYKIKMLTTEEYTSLSAAQMRAGLDSSEYSSAELTEKALELAESVGKELNCFITLCHDKARSQAKAADARIASGEAESLTGIPIAIKDNLSYTDYLTSCGSHILDGYIPPYNATAVQRLVDAGAVIIGKTNLDEFAMGSSNENSYYGPVKNPHNHQCAPGGSSGGSAAAVAAGIVPLALGSETGGSVRQPAAFCGVTGLKPTYGAVSRYGLVAFGSSLDQIGALSTTAADNAALFSVIAGLDSNDSTSIDTGCANYTADSDECKPLTIGLPKECFDNDLHPDMASAVETLKAKLTEAGHTLVDVSLPLLEAGIACYYLVATAEASANLARFDGVKYGLRVGDGEDLMEMYCKTRGAGFGAEVKRRIMLGTYILSAGYYDAYYIKGMKVRELIRQDLERVFGEVDILLTPTTPTPAFKLGEKVDDPLAMYLSDIFTVMSNLSGIPSISTPMGKSAGGLPLGAHFVAPHLGEQTLFQISAQVESFGLK
ncbi:Asp-tRNA(Asn)/Glu-tRNA(Gln) amidotransferase subunit GatA [Gemmatimonas aurantiaca]|nr:Asp-tRNA(Asn)/Glu-tRNA(Gln) amidotransferase subunit GatA [Gemmatimonas aurantiaca]